VILGASFTGVDFSEVAIKVAKSRFPEHSWLVADVASIALKQKFDLVVCTEVIEHVLDPVELIASLKDLVDPGGHLILTTQAGEIHQTEKAVGHVQHFTMKELELMFLDAGLKVVSKAQWGWPGYLLLKKLANLNADQTMKKLGSGMYNSIAIVANHIAYWLTFTGSFPNSRRGTQLVILAQLPRNQGKNPGNREDNNSV